ncbi:hypothetical protein M0813_08665 [Anaeramoeba flamelloides]|uniref:Kinetochore protein Spc24 n=1 Tax=Anaeramoeba flamelloides TaxID=1746091 RepID=A0ABQ8X7L3_9EUKA|nr:hypothetical protein M0813_08665 [Anaeramoeba flamelloides]
MTNETQMNDTLNLMDELFKILDTQKDTEIISKIQENKSTIQKINTKRQNIIKETIQELTTNIKQIERGIQKLQQTQENEKQKIFKKKDQLNQKVLSIEKQQESLNEEFEVLSKKEKEQENKLSQLEDQSSTIIPQLSYKMSLYANISGIKWKKEQSENNNVKGIIATQTDIKEFDLDPKKKSNFFITNKLWDLMD